MNPGRATQRWSRAEAGKMLDSWKASGQSLESFAKARGFSAQRLNYWRKRVSEKDSPLPSNLVPALVTLPAAAAITVQVPGGVVLEVADASAVPPDWAATFVKTLLRREP